MAMDTLIGLCTFRNSKSSQNERVTLSFLMMLLFHLLLFYIINPLAMFYNNTNTVSGYSLITKMT